MATNTEGNIPFLRAEDLHMWLIALTLFMVLSSSLSFVSNHFGSTLELPWVEFAIVLTWVFVFGASVLLWSLALFLNNGKADWSLLFASMCVITISRSLLPFCMGECMVYNMFIGFNFFTPRPTWKISALCIFSVFLKLLSNSVWGVLPPFIVALKSVETLIVVAAGHIGYQAVLVFSKHMRVTKRAALPIFSCLSECEGRRKSDGWMGFSTKGIHIPLSKPLLRQKRSHCVATLLGLRKADGRFSCGTNTAETDFTNNSRRVRLVFPSSRVETRLYWTTLQNCGPLYLQAVQKRMKLLKDDMLRFATDIEDTGVWCREKESKLFVVPRGNYGYVDCRWYLDMKFAGLLHRFFTPLFSCGKALRVVPKTSGRLFLEGGIFSKNAVDAAHNECVHLDNTEALGCTLSQFYRSLSLGKGLEGHIRSWEGGAELCPPYSAFATEQGTSGGPSGPQAFADSITQGGSPGALQDLLSPARRETGVRKSGRKMKGFCLGGMLPRVLQKTSDVHRHCVQKQDRWSRRPAWMTTLSEHEALSKMSKGIIRNHDIKQSAGRWGCYCPSHSQVAETGRSTDGRGQYCGTGAREEVIMPKMKLGIFIDSAIERWYILWRADHIVGFYKATASINMFICVLQCIFGVARGLILECLSQTGGYRVVSFSSESNLLREALASLSPGMIFPHFGRHVAQLGILVALVLPMKLIDSRGGRNVWKFQLLGLGQAVTHLAFVFVDDYLACYRNSLRHFENDKSTLASAAAHFAIGGYLTFPVFMIAINVHLRRVPEVTILLATVGSAITTVWILSVLGWELNILWFQTLSRTLFAVLAIMIARSFETIRRELFSTQVLPLLLYLSTLANSRRVSGILAMRARRGYASTH